MLVLRTLLRKEVRGDWAAGRCFGWVGAVVVVAVVVVVLVDADALSLAVAADD
jgi:hypothetical protein